MKIIKIMARCIGYFLAFIIAVIALWWVAATIRGDDPLDAGMEEFYHLDPTGYEKDNGAIAMRGLQAPASQEDSYAWALKIVDDKVKENKEEEIKNAGKYTYWELAKERFGLTKSSDSSAKKQDTSDYSDFKGSAKSIYGCSKVRWFVSKDNQPRDHGICNKKDLEQLTKDNQLLLSRYKPIMKNTNYFSYLSYTLGTIYGQEMLGLQDITMSQLIEMSATNRDQAVREWIDNMEFYNRAVTGKINLIELSILMVARGTAQTALPAILGNDSQIAQKYQRELLTALRPISAKDVHCEYEFKLLYEAAYAVFQLLDNYNKNKVFRAQKEFVDAWNSPWEQRDARLKNIKDAAFKEPYQNLTWSDWHSPVSSIFAELITDGMLVGGDLAKAMDLRVVRGKLLSVYVQMIAGNIKLESPQFIAAVPPELSGVFSIQYDPDQKIFYYVYPIPEKNIRIKEGIFLN